MHSSTTYCCGVLTAGDSNESYMLFMCKEAKNMGWRSVAMNYRSVRMKRTIGTTFVSHATAHLCQTWHKA